MINKCVNLRELDLSGNRISSLRGLDGRTLVELKSLNVSKNQLDSLDGLAALPSLFHLHLQGNNLSDCSELQALAEKLPSLKSLYLQDLGGANANPICKDHTYLESIKTHFPFLKCLDGKLLKGNYAIYQAADEASFSGPDLAQFSRYLDAYGEDWFQGEDGTSHEGDKEREQKLQLQRVEASLEELRALDNKAKTMIDAVEKKTSTAKNS